MPVTDPDIWSVFLRQTQVSRKIFFVGKYNFSVRMFRSHVACEKPAASLTKGSGSDKTRVRQKQETYLQWGVSLLWTSVKLNKHRIIHFIISYIIFVPLMLETLLTIIVTFVFNPYSYRRHYTKGGGALFETFLKWICLVQKLLLMTEKLQRSTNRHLRCSVPNITLEGSFASFMLSNSDHQEPFYTGLSAWWFSVDLLS